MVKLVSPLTKELVEITTEEDGNVLLSAVTTHFPGATGLKYKRGSGIPPGWVKVEHGILYPPLEGWEAYQFLITTARKGTGNRRTLSSPYQQVPILSNQKLIDRNDSATKRKSFPPAAQPRRSVSRGRSGSDGPAIPVRHTKKSAAVCKVKGGNKGKMITQDEDQDVACSTVWFAGTKCGHCPNVQPVENANVMSSVSAMGIEEQVHPECNTEKLNLFIKKQTDAWQQHYNLCVSNLSSLTEKQPEDWKKRHSQIQEDIKYFVQQLPPECQEEYNFLLQQVKQDTAKSKQQLQPSNPPCKYSQDEKAESTSMSSENHSVGNKNSLDSSYLEKVDASISLNTQEKTRLSQLQQEDTPKDEKTDECNISPKNNNIQNENCIKQTEDLSCIDQVDASHTSVGQQTTIAVEEEVGNEIQNGPHLQKESLLQTEQQQRQQVHSEETLIATGSTSAGTIASHYYPLHAIQESSSSTVQLGMFEEMESNEDQVVVVRKEHAEKWKNGKGNKEAVESSISPEHGPVKKTKAPNYTAKTKIHTLDDLKKDEIEKFTTCGSIMQKEPTINDLKWKHKKELMDRLDPITHSVNWYCVGRQIFHGDKEKLNIVEQFHHSYVGGGDSGGAFLKYLRFQSDCTVKKFVQVAESFERNEIKDLLDGSDQTLLFNDLDDQVTTKISLLLNISGRGIRGWREFAYALGCSEKVVEEFQNAVKEREETSPTADLLRLIKTSTPGYTLQTFGNDLLKAGRTDLKQYMDGVIESIRSK